MMVEARLQSAAALCIGGPVPTSPRWVIGAPARWGGRVFRADGPERGVRHHLLRAIDAQEMVAFNTLYDRSSRLVFSTAYRVLNDAGAAEDVVQDVYVRLWQRPERCVEERVWFIGWLLSVMRNRAIDEIRSRGRRPLSET